MNLKRATACEFGHCDDLRAPGLTVLAVRENDVIRHGVRSSSDAFGNSGCARAAGASTGLAGCPFAGLLAVMCAQRSEIVNLWIGEVRERHVAQTREDRFGPARITLLPLAKHLLDLAALHVVLRAA